jgi:hypothetical protein
MKKITGTILTVVLAALGWGTSTAFELMKETWDEQAHRIEILEGEIGLLRVRATAAEMERCLLLPSMRWYGNACMPE